MIAADFYTRDNVVDVARELLGKVLCSQVDGRLTKAIITETEAYAGINDRASHAYGGRRTQRTEPMFSDGGIAYVYLCYGIHHLFNVVTGKRNDPLAVLVRAGSPLVGIDEMLAQEPVTEAVVEEEELELVSTQMLRRILIPEDDEPNTESGFNPYDSG